MKDIKELAQDTIDEMWPGHGTLILHENDIVDFATRLIAAYLAEQEPVAWVPQFSWQRSIDAVACSSKRSFDDIPLFTAPPEPTQAVESAIAQLVTALQQSKGWMRDYADSIIRDAIDRKTASSSEEVQSSLKWLRKAEFGAMQEYASRIADMIERLAARVPDGCVVVPKDLIDAAKNLLAVKGRHHTELAYKQLCQALIAAGEVK